MLLVSEQNKSLVVEISSSTIAGGVSETLVTVGQNHFFFRKYGGPKLNFFSITRSFWPPVAKLWPNVFQYISRAPYTINWARQSMECSIEYFCILARDVQRLFFSFQNVYLPILNGTTCVVHVLSHRPYGFLANTFMPIVFLVYLT